MKDSTRMEFADAVGVTVAASIPQPLRARCADAKRFPRRTVSFVGNVHIYRRAYR